jgi:hypothetical protein
MTRFDGMVGKRATGFMVFLKLWAARLPTLQDL